MALALPARPYRLPDKEQQTVQHYRCVSLVPFSFKTFRTLNFRTRKEGFLAPNLKHPTLTQVPHQVQGHQGVAGSNQLATAQ